LNENSNLKKNTFNISIYITYIYYNNKVVEVVPYTYYDKSCMRLWMMTYIYYNNKIFIKVNVVFIIYCILCLHFIIFIIIFKL